jgi:four helix bundle protein
MKDEPEEDMETLPGADRPDDLRNRTLHFGLSVVRLTAGLSRQPEVMTIRWQLVRSGTSPGAQYREACRARSNAEFISKMEGALQELDETAYWLDMLRLAEFCPSDRLEPIARECDELIRIFVRCVKNAKGHD